MRKKWSLILIVMLVGLMLLSLTGCATEAIDDNNGDDVTPPFVPAEVIMEAAETYFAAVAADNNIIASKTLKAMLDANPDSVFILDIRKAEDFEAGHIAGAFHSEWGKVGEIMDRIPTNKPVVVACYSGQTAGQTVAALRMTGFDNVKSLQTGVKYGWVGQEQLLVEGTGMNAAANLPVITTPADKKAEILWQAAKDMFVDIAAGNRGQITPVDLHAGLQANPDAFYLLDIREAEGGEHDFYTYRIEGSIHSPWSKVGELLDDLPKTRPVVVICYSGQTAGQTVGVLRMLGFDTKALAFGIRDGWVGQENLPVKTD